jgi:3-deoxy-manno-octulosonate cytidylyltransferase (CMP-KDO synthetase)
MGQSKGRVVAAIPARWGSTRFPGKILALLAGEPMIVHVVRRAMSARLVDEVVVATDDERIAEAVKGEGCVAVLTGECPSGTDRIAEAVSGRGDAELVINVQGDEPLLSGRNVDLLVEGMRERPEMPIGTLCRPLEAERADDPNAVKVVRDLKQRALYFSRSAVPFPRDRQVACAAWKLHLGIYAFRPEALTTFVKLPVSELEKAEALEQLRALENGIEILVLDAPDPAFGVDTEEDLRRVEAILVAQD